MTENTEIITQEPKKTSRSRKLLLVLCILRSLSLVYDMFNFIYLTSFFGSFFNGLIGGYTNLQLFFLGIWTLLLSLFISAVLLVFYWISYGKWEGDSGKKWAVFVLVTGIIMMVIFIAYIPNLIDGLKYISGRNIITGAVSPLLIIVNFILSLLIYKNKQTESKVQ